MACGGLLGNVLFFAISGYCLANVSKNTFGVWYVRRIVRMYPAVWIVTGVCFLLGTYDFGARDPMWWCVYPTYYHFVSSIALLYVPFYIVMRNDFLRKRLTYVVLGLLAAWIFVYFFKYDRSYYHIDNVREPIIRILFMVCMLIGAWFRLYDDRFRNKRALWKIGVWFVVLAAYFASKTLLVKRPELAPFQLINQLVLVAAVIATFIVFSAFDSRLAQLPRSIKGVVELTSALTLEIYVVQYDALIRALENAVPFPLNWLALTAAIFACAYVLHLICNWISATSDKALRRDFADR